MTTLEQALQALQAQLDAGLLTREEHTREAQRLHELHSPASTGADFFATGGAPPSFSPVVSEPSSNGADFFATGGGAPFSHLPESSSPQVLAHRYELQALAGSGGMGQVWKAWDRQCGEIVAIKLLHGESITDEWLRSFRGEMEVLQRLRHPGIVAFRGLEKDAEQGFFFVMEWFDGQPLSVLLEQARREGTQSPLTPAASLVLLKQLVEALDTAHQQGVVHLDLKPANILRTQDGRCKLIDFGIARLQGAQQGGIQGTAYYMAPEQLRGETVLTKAADVYSLGIVAYQLWTGQLFQGGMPGPSHLQPALSSMVDVVHSRAVSWQPLERFQSVREWWEAIEQAWSAKPDKAMELVEPAREKVRRERAIGRVVQETEDVVQLGHRWEKQLAAIEKKRPSWLSQPLQRKPPRLLHLRRPSLESVEEWRLLEDADVWWLLSRQGERLCALQSVSAGNFTMGAERRAKGARRQDKPAKQVELSTYLMMTQPLSVRAWQCFVEESGYTPSSSFRHPEYQRGSGDPEDVVSHLSVAHVWAFCDFYGVTLPSEAQWERGMQHSNGHWQHESREWVADEYDATWLRKLKGVDPVLQSQQRSRFVSIRGEIRETWFQRQGLASDSCEGGLGFRVVMDVGF
jgi:serine/threonine protein kinase